MSNRGHFGKCVDIKRLNRLCRTKIGAHLSNIDNRVKLFNPRKSSGLKLHQGPDVSVRLAKISDNRFIKLLSGKVFNIYGPYEEIIPKWFDSGITMTLIALLNGQPVGFSMIGEPLAAYNIEHATELLAIAIIPKNQGRGFGEILLRELERKTQATGLKRIYLHTDTKNIHAQRLFARMDYRTGEIKKNFYPEGQDAVVMSKDLRDIF